jgi:hypothetical protein
MPGSHNPGIAEPHQSVVTAIRHAAQQGWFSSAEAQAIIDRVRAQSPPADRPAIRTERWG